MALNWQAVNGDFFGQLYLVLKAFEAPTLSAVPVNGNLTIGLGFDLNTGSPDLKRRVLLAMGLVDPATIQDATALTIELGYWDRLTSAFNGSDASVLSAIMAERAANTNAAYVAAMAQYTRRPQFAFNSENEIRAVYNAVAETDYLAKIYIGYPELQSSPGFASSKERLVLGSLVWNGGTGLLGKRLGAAIQNNDRAEAWYEIRYNSNSLAKDYITKGVIDPKGIDKGLARRRYAESEIFGLYDDITNVSETDAKSVYRAFTRHRDYIKKYESAYGGIPDGATESRGDMVARANAYGLMVDGWPVIVGTLQSELTQATNYLRETYLTVQGIGTDIAWNHILVGEDQSTLYYKGTDSDLLAGTGQSDLIIGESGTDILKSGGGSDVLYGGSGLDLYDVNGGFADDTYIIDSDGRGAIVTGSEDAETFFAVGKREAQPDGSYTGPWQSRDGNITYTWSGNDGDPLTITQGGNTYIVQDYHRDTLGIHLLDLPADPQNGVTPLTNVPSGTSWDTIVLNPFFPEIGEVRSYGRTNEDSAEFINASESSYPMEISGHGGGDKILGSQFSDRLKVAPDSTSDTAANYLDGGASNDVISGGFGKDHLIGGTTDDGKDFLDGGSGADWIEGGAGNDALFGGDSADLLEGGVGDDWLFGNSFINDVKWNWSLTPVATLLAEAMEPNSTFYRAPDPTNMDYYHDTVDIAGDVLDGGAGSDFLWGGSGNDYLDGGDDGDMLLGHDGDDLLLGDGGGDYLVGGNHNDLLFGGSGDDLLHGDETGVYGGAPGNDILYGGSGADRLNGQYGDDILIGGTEDDILYGGEGVDTYVFNLGDGADIANDPDPEARNVILFGIGVNKNDIRLNFESSMVIEYGVGDRIQINGFDRTNASSAQSFGFLHFASGDIMSYEELIALGFDIAGTVGDDSLVGTSVVDRIDGGEGADMLWGGGGDDTVRGGAGNDQLIGGMADDSSSGNDLLYGGDGDDVIWGEDGDDILHGEGGNDLILAGTGNDFLYGGAGNDTLQGEAGDDVLDGGAGMDFLYGGDGNDVLGGAFGTDDYSGGTYPPVGNDYHGGHGDDLLHATLGGDTFYFDLGDGHDTIEFTYAGGTLFGTDLIRFGAGIVLADVSVSRQGNDVTLNLVSGDQVTIRNWFAGAGNQPSVQFSDGYSWGNSAITALAVVVHGTAGDDVIDGVDSNYFPYWDTIYGHEGNDIIRGYDGFDTLIGGPGDDRLEGGYASDRYEYYLGDGSDRIIEIGTNSDTLRFNSGIAASDIQIGREINDLVLTIRGTDRVVIENALVDANARVESFVFSGGGSLPSIQTIINSLVMQNGTAGDDVLVGSDGYDVLSGLAGNDALYGNGYADTLNGNEGDDTLMGGAGDDTVNGHDGNDILDGGTGADTLNGALGNDVYRFGRGDGADTITDQNITAGNLDTILLGSDVLPADVLLGRNATDLYVRLIGTQDQITVRNWFVNDTNKVERIEFSDGTVWDTTQIYDLANTATVYGDYIVGTAGADLIDALAGNDRVFAGEGNDTVYGNDGNDDLYGGNGDDTIDGGAGQNYIEGGAGDDELFVGSGIDSFDFASSVDGGDGNDSIFGSQCADWINTGSGRNIIDGGGGDDRIDEDWASDGLSENTYLIGRGSGMDEVFRSNGPDGALPYDTVVFGPGITVEDLSVQVGHEYDVDYYAALAVGIGQGDGIWFQTYNPRVFSGSVGVDDFPISFFEFADGTRLTVADVLALADEGIVGTQDVLPGDVWVMGSQAPDYIQSWNSLDATSRITQARGGDDNVNYWYLGDDVIDGGYGDDVIDAGSGNNTLVGGRGDDFLWGRDYTIIDDLGNVTSFYATNVYAFNRGDGVDEVSTTANSDTLSWGATIRPEDILVYIESVNASTGVKIAFSIAGTGDVVLGGPDIEWAQFVSESGTHLFDLQNLVLDRYGEVLAATEDNPLQLFAGADFYEVTGSEPAKGGEWARSYGITGDLFAIMGTGNNDVLNGTESSDTLFGDASNDILTGGGGRDRLFGGIGDDSLSGGAGNDTYLVGLGAGQDRIAELDGTDQIEFGSGIDTTNLVVSRVADDLVVSYSQTDAITIENWFAGQRIESVLFADGVVMTAAELEAMIGGQPANRPPTVGTALADIIVQEDSALILTLSVGAFTDPDNGDTLTYGAVRADGTPLPAWLNFDPLTLTLSGTPTNGDVGSFDVRVIATDSHGASASDVFALTVANTNDAPTVTGTIADQNVSEDSPFALVLPAGVFADDDAIHGDSFAYSMSLADGSELPAWLSFDPATRTLGGTPSNGDVGVFGVRVTATDGAGASAFTDFGLTVTNVNDAPIAVQTVADQVAIEDSPFEFALPVGVFMDEDAIHGDTLSYSTSLADGSALPAWLGFDVATGVFSGTPTNFDVGNLALAVTATDSIGVSATTTFGLVVQNVNDAPNVVSTIPNQSANEDALFSLVLPAGAFVDDDLIHGDVLTYSASLADGSALPAWLTFDPATQAFSGTPGNSDVGLLSIRITVTDSAGMSAAADFGLNVNNVNDAPELVGAVPDQQVDEYANLSFTLPANLVTDQDQIHGDTLTYSATLADGSALPAWLVFDPSTQTFSGNPVHADVGTHAVRVTTTDQAMATASIEFAISVQPVGNAIVGGDSGGGLVGTAGADTMVGGSGSDVIGAGGGNDILDAGSGNDALLGGAGNDLLLGGAGNDVLSGGTGADTLAGGAGNDVLTGGTGNDLYRFGYGDGQDQLLDIDATAGNSDTVAVDASALDLVFARSGLGLSLSLHGSTDSLMVQGWGLGSTFQTEVFQTADSYQLLNTQVDQLIQAMATFSANNGGITWDQAIDQRPDEVQAIITAYWQAG